MSGLRRAAVVALLLSATLAAPAAGQDYIVGLTWYSHGSYYEEVPAGAAISVFATGARPNRFFRLSAIPFGTPGDFPCPAPYAIQIHPSLRGSTSRGLIPTTTTVLNEPPGEYTVCFHEQPLQPGAYPPSATAPLYLVVL